MPQENSQPGHEATSPQGGPPSRNSGDKYPQGSPDHDELLRRYGEAMLRIGQLEAQVAHLMSQLQQGAAQGSHPSGSPRSRGLQGSGDPGVGTDSLAKTSRPREHSLPQGPQVDIPHDRQRDEGLRQLRVQISSLANQLAQTEDELKEVTGRRARHRRHSEHPRPWWTRLARRLGLRGSR